MTPAAPSRNLSVLMASIRQQALNGELVLEQNDGTRRLYFTEGALIYLQSDVAGEQFGNYLLRQGILDFSALNELLANEEQYRLGEKVIQWGMMTVPERDCHLLSMQEQVMIHALEHAVLELTWKPGSLIQKLSEDLHFQLEHRHFVWNTFQEAHHHTALYDLLYAQSDWQWEGRSNLLESVADLPLNPTTAFALSFLGSEPISFETFLSLGRLSEEQAASLLVTLWALGALTLAQGVLPALVPVVAPEGPVIPAEPAAGPPAYGRLPFILPPSSGQLPPATALESLRLDPLPATEQPEFLDLEQQAIPTAPTPVAPTPVTPGAPTALDPPTQARKLVIQAKRLLLQERTGEAIRALEQAVQLDCEADSAFEAWLLLGQLRMSNPAWSTRAIDALQTASRLCPKAAEPWASMGEVYFRKAFRANAIACFQRALELDPSVPVPPGVDLQEALASTHPSAANASLFTRFKAMLGGEDK